MEVVMDINLTASERELLLSILEQRHRELSHELSRTAHHGFKASLKENIRMIDSMLSKLRVARPAQLTAV